MLYIVKLNVLEIQFGAYARGVGQQVPPPQKSSPAGNEF